MARSSKAKKKPSILGAMMSNQTRSVYLTIRCDVPTSISIEDFTSECDIVINYDEVEINQTLEDAEE